MGGRPPATVMVLVVAFGFASRWFEQRVPPVVMVQQSSTTWIWSATGAAKGSVTFEVGETPWLALGKRVPLNSATAAALQTVGGIGPKRAEKIIEYIAFNGPFDDLSELAKVKGIGPKTVQRVAPFLVVGVM